MGPVFSEFDFSKTAIALFSAGGSVSEEHAPRAAAAGCVVIDNSTAFRMSQEHPLVIPEVNADALENHQGIIANPNCSTIQMLVTLKPIHDKYKIKRVVVSTYQSVTGTGKAAVDQLFDEHPADALATHGFCNDDIFQIHGLAFPGGIANVVKGKSNERV